ncbi:MAG: ABC transporter permease [Thermoflexales bacterium]|nr:ABC transporter permease [Thermoflexales bacterium]
MGQFIVRRFLWMLLVLFVVSFITFFLMHQVPGGPFDREKALPPEIKANLEQRYHLDWPLWRQYADYVFNVLVPRITTQKPTGSLLDQYFIELKIGSVYFRWMNFGPSFASRSRTVNDIFRDQLPISFQLGVMALILAMVVGIPLGIISALRQNTIVDYVGMSLAIFGVSVPVIVMGPILISIFAVSFSQSEHEFIRSLALPATGWGAKPPYVLGFLPTELSWNYFRYALMPSVALGLGSSALLARLTRASLLQVIREDYIRTARAKGLAERVVITRHALKNSLIPVATVLGPMFAALVTGTFVTELIFGIPGLGRYFITSITNRDYPVIMGTILLYAMVLVLANAIVDIMYAFLDPRIRIT